ncbi:MAG: hypothetical protein GTO14_11720 [Anaerolineales bacterium]|nr:hypothetical protein [Anaerolineales bacterium]
MGSLADLILALSSDTPAIVASEYPLASFKGINADGLDPLKLAALHSVFTAEDFNSLLEHYKPIAESSSSGPWLIKFPDELIKVLAELAPHDHASIAAKWASTDPLQEEGWSEQDAEQFLDRIAYYAQTAFFEDKNLFLWIYG